MALVAQLAGVVPQLGLRGLELAAPGRSARARRTAPRAPSPSRTPLASARCSSLKLGAPSSRLRPDHALGAQRLAQAHHVEQVPARIAVAPLAFVGVVEIAVQAEAHELVVEADRVVADRAGSRARHLVVQCARRIRLRGRPSRNACCGVMPVIRVASGEGSRSSAGWQNRLIGSSTGFRSASVRMAGELRDARAARVAAEGLQVVPEEGGGHDSAPRSDDRRGAHHVRRRQARSTSASVALAARGVDQQLALHLAALERGGVGHAHEADHRIARHEAARVAFAPARVRAARCSRKSASSTRSRISM